MSRPSGEVGAVAGASVLSNPKEVFIMFPAPNCDERLYESQKKFLESKGHKVHVEYVVDSMGIEDYAKYVMEKSENIEELKALYMDMTKQMGPKAFATQAGYMVQVGKDDRRFAVSGDGRDVDKIAGDIARDTVANMGLSVNLAMIDGAGHLSTIEKAEKVNDIMGEVLSKINPRGRVK